ncbi:MAG TPA: hypothetical protein VHR45_20925 [Thermoanaerobaculia bacterium]|nr:hypothetical protein [Thermoanaerobaculia bacterium]
MSNDWRAILFGFLAFFSLLRSAEAAEHHSMKLSQAAPQAFILEFESEEELRAEERAHLSVGGLFLRPAGPLAPFAKVTVALRLPGRGETTVAAIVVGSPPGGLALQFEGDPATVVAVLLAEPAAEPEESEPETATLWERLHGMTLPQKILLAPKADRLTRALLVQESDQQVLFALLKNPRLSVDEVVRVAKSSYLSFQAAELILKTGGWASSLEVRLALVHNPKLPVPFALRILPTLPDREVRAIAKGAATSMPLRQAALKRIQGA